VVIPQADKTSDGRFHDILEAALAAKAPSRGECRYLLEFGAHSLEAGVLRATANAINRRRFGNAGLVLGQIGVHMEPCDAGCAFCAFAKPHTTIRKSTLSMEESVQRANAFSRGGATGIFIMTMHRFGFDWFLNYVSQMRSRIPAQTELLANVGDISVEQLKALKSAGLTGAYHVVRLGEGRDTHLTPGQRLRTIEQIRMAGLDWYNSCEPIGPEHTAEEIVEQIFTGMDLGYCQHAAMRRFPVPGSPLFRHGRLPLTRLAQVVAVVALASLETDTVRSIAVHESNLLGLMSGANALYAEAGEPMEVPVDAGGGAGGSEEGFSSALWRRSQEITTADCRTLLIETGYDKLVVAPGKTRPLTHPADE
jgi:biotin synthase